MNSKRKKRFFCLIWILSLTWNCIVTYIGLTVALILILFKHKPFILEGFIFFEIGNNWGGINLGLVCIISKNNSLQTKIHEIGHGIQGIIFGVFYPLLIAIPSALRYQYYTFTYNFNKTKYYKLKDYDSIWFEKNATNIGKQYFQMS